MKIQLTKEEICGAIKTYINNELIRLPDDYEITSVNMSQYDTEMSIELTKKPKED